MAMWQLCKQCTSHIFFRAQKEEHMPSYENSKTNFGKHSATEPIGYFLSIEAKQADNSRQISNKSGFFLFLLFFFNLLF